MGTHLFRAKHVNITTTEPEWHELVVKSEAGVEYRINVDVKQLMILLQQGLSIIWTHYKQVPRE